MEKKSFNKRGSVVGIMVNLDVRGRIDVKFQEARSHYLEDCV